MTAAGRAAADAAELMERPTADNIQLAAEALQSCAHALTPEDAMGVRGKLMQVSTLLDAAMRTRLACMRIRTAQACGYTAQGVEAVSASAHHVEIEA